ncbi:MAG: hypothetical protein C0P77_003375 [Thermoanaerobacterales bacterium]|jgi:hypothetical protein|nr:hypothetical protein [Thermoanaerobacterales bacterium]
MATLIRATCSTCGDVELGTGELVVRLCEDTEAGTYVFRCPACTRPVVRPADRPTIDLLVASGCRLEVWRTPAELQEERPAGRPFTHDDLIDFHETLAGDGWFEDLLAAHRRRR